MASCFPFRRVVRLVALLLLVALATAPALAERPIVDLHRLDAYFALFASDSNVPWKTTTVRLDTYSSAPVHFSVYQVDPADVLTAGSNARPRAIDVRKRRPIISFDFTPPGGYQFQSNEVDTQLGSREGFFVVEARRGDVGEQVWVNRTRVGLIAKQTSSEVLLYGTDLGTGRALARMRVQFVVGNRFATELTDQHGVVRWTRRPRPVFALAQWGNSYAFVSLFPQAPLPQTVVGVRTDSADVHAGEVLRAFGFARTRSGDALRPASGTASVTLRLGAESLGTQTVALDRAGAFSTAIAIPKTARAGDYALLAQVDGGVAGATVHVDADANGLSLGVAARCGICNPDDDVPLLIHSSRPDTEVHVGVVRSPHVYLDYTPEQLPWATTTWLDANVRTGDNGDVVVEIPHPTDALGSTYGVRVESGGATANTRIVVPTSRVALRVHLDRAQQSLGAPVGFDIYARDVDTGRPVSGAVVDVELVHGTSVQRQPLTLDRNGHARGSFSSAPLGTNLVMATLHDASGTATDAAQIEISERADRVAVDTNGSAAVHIALDRPFYRSGETVAVDARATGAQGDAFLTLESALGMQSAIVATHDGQAHARFRAQDAPGRLQVGAAFVSDGTIAWGTVPLGLDAPGRPQASALDLPASTFAPAQIVDVALRGVATAGTIVVRVSRGEPSGSALFESAPALLAVGVTTTQTSASPGVTWHPWVNSTGDHAQVLGFVRRTEAPQVLSLAQAQTIAVSWSVSRVVDGKVAVTMPSDRGRYTLSLLDVTDDGRVVAGSSTIEVR